MTDLENIRRIASSWFGTHRRLLLFALLAVGGVRAMDTVSEIRVEAEADRFEAIAYDVATLVDGDELAGALAASRTVALPKRAATVEALRKFAESNGLDHPMRVLSIKEDLYDQLLAAPESEHPGVLEVLLTTSAVDGGQTDAGYTPTMMSAFFDRRTAFAREEGSFASTDFLAYAPVLDSFDATVAVLEIPRRSFTALASDVLGAIAKVILVFLVGVIFVRSLARPLKEMREVLAERSELVAQERRSSPRADDLSTKLEDVGRRFERTIGRGGVERAAHDDVAWAVEAATRAVKRLARERRVKIHSAIPDELGASVLARADLLYTVLEPLLDNAVRYTQGGGSATVHVLTDANDQSIRFEVADTGVGIPWEDQYFLLRPASEEDGTRLRRTGGLDVARSALEQLGGQIGFESQPGLGTRIWFTVPPSEFLGLRESA